MGFEWGSAGRPIAGESSSGDAYLVHAVAGGLLLAVVDGLGHGAEAAIAASAAIRVLEIESDRPLVPLFEHCHAALHGTRGVAMSVAHVAAQTGRLTWLGVGNVELLLVRPVADDAPRVRHGMLRNGVVGMWLPRLLVSQDVLEPGDLVILATDGISSRFYTDLDVSGDPCGVATRILERHARASDDALVLVVRYLGREGEVGPTS